MITPEEVAKKAVDDAINRLGLPKVISDEELDKELDEMLAEDAPNAAKALGASFDVVMMEQAKRRFLYRKDLGIVAAKLADKLKTSRIAESC
jgi:hypothetical protein